MQLTLTQTPWCYLYRLYNLKTGRLEMPGDKATYGCTVPGEDEEIYRLTLPVGKDPKHGGWMVPRDQELSLVYPERVFVWAVDDHGQDITDREVLRACLKEMGVRDSWQPVSIHHGWKNGHTWHNALRAHTDFGVRWYEIQQGIERVRGRWQIDDWYKLAVPFVTLWFEDKEVAGV